MFLLKDDCILIALYQQELGSLNAYDLLELIYFCSNCATNEVLQIQVNSDLSESSAELLEIISTELFWAFRLSSSNPQVGLMKCKSPSWNYC